VPKTERVIDVTLRADAILEDAARAAIDDAVRAEGGTVDWRTSERAGRTYGVAAVPAEAVPRVEAAAAGLTLFRDAIIALAVYPSVPEALPLVLDALTGPGRPAGVLDACACVGGIAVEWNPAVTGAAIVMGLIDVELARVRAARATELLSPLTVAVEAAIAAEGLATPEIVPERILDVALERAGIRV
jgi:hypothetical protein